ncbi:MAG: translocation/assembly module TamB domain-containing protein, partial [Myxococcales bacterium]|nr:translocation/assembly module TamB domain-containing protein [Myxococcales bacterium]
LPEPLRALLPEAADPLVGTVVATLHGGSEGTSGDLFSSLEWYGDLSDRPCGGGSRPKVNIRAHLGSGRTTADATVLIAGRTVFRGQLTAATPIDAWVAAAGIDSRPSLDLRGSFDDAPLEAIPLLCERGAGRLTGTIQAQGILSDAPQAFVRATSPDLRIRRFDTSPGRRRASPALIETPPMPVQAEIRLSPTELRIGAQSGFWNGGQARTSATIPIRWGGEDISPGLDPSRPVEGETDLSGMPLEGVMIWIPGIDDVDGTLDGRVRLAGQLDAPSLGGRLTLTEGRMDITTLGQRLHSMQGEVELSGDRILLREIIAQDGEGTTQMDGEIELTGLLPTRLRLDLQAESFPVRQEGSVLATLSGEAELDARFGLEGVNGTLTVGDLHIDLPEESSRSQQELDPHSDIVVVGETRSESADVERYPIELDVRAPRPFFVRSPQFTAQVLADLHVHYAVSDFRVSGEVGIARGFFEVFGKRFEVREATMLFDGGEQLNPEVLLRAVHELRSRAGETVSVAASGRLSRPTVSFSTTLDGCNEEGQIISLLVSGQCNLREERAATNRSGDAAGEAMNFLAGVTAGVLTLSLREQFGRHIPVIVVESGDQAFRSARIRAGYDASDLLPEALRRVVTGAYVEGSVNISGTEEGSGDTQAAGVGFLMELRFPNDIVTTGTVSSGANWSFDLTWEP